MYNRSPVFLDFYDDYKYTNGNCWIGGSSGAGKTFTLNCLGGRLRQQGKRVLYIIPKKGHEFRPQCEQLGGLYLRLSPSSKDCPNILAIRRKSLDSYSELKNMTARDDSILAEKISRLIIWYSLQKRDLSDEDKNHLDSSLVDCYRRYGITFDNSSITDENGNFREMPVIPDWYDVLQEKEETKHLAVVLARYVTGSAAAMGQRNDIDLNNKYIVLDVSGMPDDRSQLQSPGGRLCAGNGQDDPRPRRHRYHVYPGNAGPVRAGRRKIRQGDSGFQPHQAGDADGGTENASDPGRAESLRG